MNIQQHMIQFSVNDTIGILDASPAKADLIPEVTVIQIMNRASFAHLAIERAIKFLIHAAHGDFEETHTLNRLRNSLKQYDVNGEAYLSRAFDDAVNFYGYNTNSDDFKHLRSLGQYFEETGTENAFEKMRYWELGQQLQDVLIRRIDLRIHREILCAFQQLLIQSDDYAPHTVTDRVDVCIEQEIHHRMVYYQRDTSRKEAIYAILTAHHQGKSWRSILYDAVQSGFGLGDDSLSKDVYKAYQQLLQSDDPAVRYYAEKCAVLPRQQREIVPDIDWIIENRKGIVQTPMGAPLGYIQRSPDGKWFVAPLRNLPSAQTETQTDARAYLADLMSSPVTIIVNGEILQRRLVGDEGHAFSNDSAAIWTSEADLNQPNTFSLEFWDDRHGLEVGQYVKMELTLRDSGLHQLEGTVSSVQGQNVTVTGYDVFATLGESYVKQKQA